MAKFINSPLSTFRKNWAFFVIDKSFYDRNTFYKHCLNLTTPSINLDIHKNYNGFDQIKRFLDDNDDFIY